MHLLSTLLNVLLTGNLAFSSTYSKTLYKPEDYEFTKEYERSYKGEEEKQLKHEIFKHSLEEINKLNSRNEHAVFAAPTPKPDSDLFYHIDENLGIIGGTEAAEGSVPYMVALSIGIPVRTFVCGGSLISQRTVLTAAHCIDDVYTSGALSSSLRGTVGTNRWNSSGQSYAFARNVTHQHWDSRTITNDIAILITATEVVLSNLVQPVTLTFDHIPGGVSAKAVGWGSTRLGGPLSATLLELYVHTVDGQQCAEEVAHAAAAANNEAVPPVDPEVHLCAYKAVNYGVCHGDSGSALVRTDATGAPVDQIGIASWVVPCALGAPDMFVRVGTYRNWLKEHVV